MKGVLQPDLSVSGNTSTRYERPNSGSRRPQRRHPDPSAYGNSRANIFGTQEAPKPSQGSSIAGSTSDTYYSTPEAPRDDGKDEKTKVKEDNENWDQPMDVTVHESPKGKSRRSAPQGVPKLHLGHLADDNNKLVQRVEPEPHYHTPDTTRSDVSWGTPLHSAKQMGKNHKPRETRFKGHEEERPARQSPVSKRPDGMPALNLNSSQDDEHAFRAARDTVPKYSQNDPFSSKHDRPWSTEPKNEHQYMKQRARDEQEQLYSNKKKDYIVETVLVDQLSRAAISDPDSMGPESYNINLGAKARKQKEFYNTRVVQSPGKSENILAKRVRFGARLVTKNGHDIHRELNGFYFLADNTLTVYEFRQFGTRSSALPFIQRGTYYHVYGQRKGQPYSLQDIAVGKNLSFVTANQNTLPQSVSIKPVVTLRITDLDEEAKERLLYDGCDSIEQRRRISDKLAAPPTQQELRERQMIQNIQGEVRKQLRSRAVKTLMGLGRHFKQLDTSGDGMLDKQELMAALQRYHLQVPPQAFEELWKLLDVNGDGALDYGEFIRGFIGEMNESRKSYVRKVFHKLDPSKAGVVELNNIKKFFSAHKHPSVLSGQMRESEVTSAFLSSFANCENKGEVTYGEFEDYYEGVSIAIDSDQEFIAMMKNCWGC